MKYSILLLLVVACMAPGAARAQDAIIDYVGYSYETGGFLPSDPDDVMSILGVIDNLDPRLGVNLSLDEVTLYVTNLVSQGQVDQGGGIYSVAYSGGDIALYQDPSKDHDYNINPPNPPFTPNTFVNGSLLLGGTLSDFFLYYDTSTGTGAYEANCNFTSGSGLAALDQISAEGYTFGGVLSREAVGPENIPAGYDLQVDGVIQVKVPVGVEQKSWGAVKQMYKSR